MINNKITEFYTAADDDYNSGENDDFNQEENDGNNQDEIDTNDADETDAVNISGKDNMDEDDVMNTNPQNNDNSTEHASNYSENNSDYWKNNKSSNKGRQNKNKNKKYNKKYDSNRSSQDNINQEKNDNNNQGKNDNNNQGKNDNNNNQGKNDNNNQGKNGNNNNQGKNDNQQNWNKNGSRITGYFGNRDVNEYLFHDYKKYNNNNQGYKNNNNNNNNYKAVNFITGVNSNRAELIKKTFSLPFRWLGLKKTSSDPLDSFVLRLHYRFGAVFFFLAFLFVWCNIVSKDQIFCIGMEGSKPLRQYIVNICLSYSYYTMPNGVSKPILFYRWAHFACLIVAGSFLLLKLAARRFGHPHVKSLFFTLNKNASKLDSATNERTRKAIVNFFKQHARSQRSFYLIYLLNHGFAPIISFASFLFLDFVLQGQFWKLPVITFPFWRDPATFQDPLSLVFTPFVNCTIGPGSQMLNAREEEFHCHLTLMELYEKVFICAWLYLVVVMVVGLGCVCVLGCLPFVKPLLLWTCQESKTVMSAKTYLLRKLNIGDIFLLFLIKRHVSEKLFCAALLELKDVTEEYCELKVE